MVWRGWPWLLFSLVATSTCPARGAEPDQATSEALLQTGIDLRKGGHDEEALDAFRKAFAMTQEPAARAQMGLAEQALGRFVDAERDLRTALSSMPGDPWIQRNRLSLEGALRVVSGRLADVEVVTNVRGAELWINGERAGPLPLASLRTEAGIVVLEVRAPGYERLRRSIELTSGGHFREEMTLVPLAATPAGGSAGPASSAVAIPHAGSGEPGSSGRIATWAVVGAGGALLAGGIASQVIRENDVGVYNDSSLCFFGALTRDQRCGRYRAAANEALTFAIVGYGGAAIAFATAALLLAVERPKAAPPRPSRSVSCTAALLSVACGGRF